MIDLHSALLAGLLGAVEGLKPEVIEAIVSQCESYDRPTCRVDHCSAIEKCSGKWRQYHDTNPKFS